MKEFKEIFKAYGADYDTTMERFMGNEAMYLKFLNMLFKDDNLDKLGASLDKDDLTGAFEAAHTLKGVIANMGLTPLLNAVCALVTPLRARQKLDNYSELYQAVKAEFQEAEKLRDRLEGVV